MRVLILTQYYKPEPIPKPGDLAEELVRRGHQVRVITGFPNYPSGVTYPGYKVRPWSVETIDGVRVLRCFEYPYHGHSSALRVLNYATFALAAPIAAVLQKWRPDVIYVWHPPLTIGIAAWLASRGMHAPFVYDVQDIWPESAAYTGVFKGGHLIRSMDLLAGFVYGTANALITVTEPARQHLISRGAPADRVIALPNWASDELLATPSPDDVRALRAELGLEGKFAMVFAGNLGLVQGLDTIVRCATHLDDADDRFRILFVGDGTDKARLEALVDELGVGRIVRFLGRQPIDRMPLYHAVADALVVHLKESRLSDWVIPSKVVGYMGAGKPILAALDGAGAHLVEDAGAGVVVRPDDPVALAAAARTIADSDGETRERMGTSGRAYLDAHLGRARLIDRYEELLQRVAEGRPAAR